MILMRVCPKCSQEMPDAVCPKDGANTIPVAAPSGQTYPIGTLIAARYRIDAVLGIGGFGAVYKCTQLNMDQTVAVKVLRADHLSSVEHVKRFSGEAQAVSRLRHPNTIRVFDFGTHADGALYLAMEFIEGETLGHRFDTKGALPWPQLVHILTQVCHSLTEAHAAGLVHRDLKPENVMLLPVAGDPDFVKVLDFGIAKQQKEIAEGNLTETGMIMGTPSYMSPEQAKGEPIDRRSDVYALGVLAYEALVGQPPFTGDTPMTVLIKHIKDAPPSFIREGALREVPHELEQLVLQCLAKDPRQRPQTTAELAEKLVRIQETARRPAPMPAASSQDQERPTRVLPVPIETPNAALNAVAPTPSSRKPLWIAGGAFAVVLAGTAAVAMLGMTGPKEEAVTKPTALPAAVLTAPVAPTVEPPGVAPAIAAPAAAPPAPAATAEPEPVGKLEPEAARVEPAKVEPEVRRREPEARRLETKLEREARADAKAETAKIEPKADTKLDPSRDTGARDHGHDRPSDHGHSHEAFRLDDDRPDPPKK